MQNQKSTRLTYGQRKLQQLIDERMLNQWAVNNNLSHAQLYSIAVGLRIPTYRFICSICHIISPIEWLYYEDEELPYEAVTVPQWPYYMPSKFIIEHQGVYKQIGEKYGLSLSSAKNLFRDNRAYPSIQFMRRACEDYNPVDFFTAYEEKTPAQGDIIHITINSQNLNALVLSNQQHNISSKSFYYLLLTDEDFKTTNTYKISGKILSGYVDTACIKYTDPVKPVKIDVIEKLPEEQLNVILTALKVIFQ